MKLKQQWDATTHLLKWPKSVTLAIPNAEAVTGKSQFWLHVGSVPLTLCMCSVISDSLWPYGLKPARLQSWIYPWDFPGSGLEWVAISFSRGIFVTQGSNPCLLHLQVDILPQSHLRTKIGSHWNERGWVDITMWKICKTFLQSAYFYGMRVKAVQTNFL